MLRPNTPLERSRSRGRKRGRGRSLVDEGLDEYHLDILAETHGGKSQRQIAEILGRAPSSINAAVKRLRLAGLLKRETWGHLLTRTGRGALLVSSGGSRPAFVRCHRLVIEAKCRFPNREAANAALGVGVRAIRMKNWDKRAGELRVGHHRLKFQANLHSLVFYPEPIWASVADGPRKAMELVERAIVVLEERGFVFDSPYFQQEPEYAWPEPFPVVVEWARQNPGERFYVQWFDHGIWIDRSQGCWELECNHHRLALAIEATPWQAGQDFREWAEAVLRTADYP